MTLQEKVSTLSKFRNLLQECNTRNIQSDQQHLKTPDEDELTDIAENLIRMQEVKSDVKSSHQDEEKKLMLYHYLMQNPDSWPTQTDIEETSKQYKNIADHCSDWKEKIKDEKQQIEDLVELGENGLGLLEKNVKDLEEKTTELQEKIMKAENVLKNYKEKMSVIGSDGLNGSSVHEIKEKQKEQIAMLNKEIEKGRLSEERMLKQIKDYHDIVKRMTVVLNKERDSKSKKDKDKQIQSFQTKQELAKLKVILEEMQRLGGIEVLFSNDEQMKVKFLNISQPELFLQLTLDITKDKWNHTHLKHGEVNIETFHCSDLIDDAIRTNDIRGLIQLLQDRWNVYFPIMAEIETISESHAVDWIQDEGLVRVLVGKGGTVMYTLKMPPGYPFEGEITVSSTSGLPSDLTEADCVPPSRSTLKKWVDYLEEKFGKP